MFSLFLSFPAGNLLLVNVPNDVNVDLNDVAITQTVRFVDSRFHRNFFFKTETRCASTVTNVLVK